MTSITESIHDDTVQASPAKAGRRVRFAHRLSRRAVVGGLLVALSALGVFLAYLNAVSAPAHSYLVALDEIAPGTIVEDLDHAFSLFGSVPTDLAPVVAEGAVTEADVGDIVGTQMIAPMQAGDLLLRSNAVAGSDQRDAHLLAVPLAPHDALAGRLQPGQHVDVIATYSVAGDSVTLVVARDVPVTAVDGDATQGLGVAQLVITLAVADADEVLAIGHAARTASIYLTRPVGAPERRHNDEPFRPDIPPPVTDSINDVVPPTVGEGSAESPATRHPVAQQGSADPRPVDDQ